MTAPLLDELSAFVQARISAAARDKALYDRNSARLNGQLLQGEINLGTAVLSWIEARRAADAQDSEQQSGEEAAGDESEGTELTE